MGCYKESLNVPEEKPVSMDEDLVSLVKEIKASMDLPILMDESELLDHALKLCVLGVAQELVNNHALTLLSAHDMFKENVRSLLPLSTLESDPEWVGSPGGCSVGSHTT